MLQRARTIGVDANAARSVFGCHVTAILLSNLKSFCNGINFKHMCFHRSSKTPQMFRPRIRRRAISNAYSTARSLEARAISSLNWPRLVSTETGFFYYFSECKMSRYFRISQYPPSLSCFRRRAKIAAWANW